jgi:hypothetical protein
MEINYYTLHDAKNIIKAYIQSSKDLRHLYFQMEYRKLYDELVKFDKKLPSYNILFKTYNIKDLVEIITKISFKKKSLGIL